MGMTKGTGNSAQADPHVPVRAEQELCTRKASLETAGKPAWWIRLGDFLAERTGKPRWVNRKKYVKLALTCGWLCGSHRFYAGQRLLGGLYLLFFWTGIPMAMTMVDLMIALPKVPDEDGMIEL